MIETINRRNYERFLIDFADGTLSLEQHAQVVLFLEQNPDIAEEFEGINEIEIKPLDSRCENIDSLKKSILQPLVINNENYEHYFIAYHEGDLTDEEKAQVDEYIALNEELEKEFLLFQKISFKSNTKTSTIDKSDIRRITIANGENILEKDYYNLCIAYHEGDLDEEHISIINKTIENSTLAAKIFNSFATLQLTADENIVFQNKSSLKKKGIIVFGSFARISTSVAAAIAFLVLYYFGWQPEENSHATFIAPTHIVKPITVTNNTGESKNMVNNKAESKSNDNVIAKSTTHRTKPQSSLNKSAIETVDYKPASEKLASRNIDMQLIAVDLQEKFVKNIDTGYYMVVASNDNSIIEKRLPSSFKSTLRKVTRIFIREKEELKAESPQSSIMNIAQYAVAGFNKMTENNYALDKTPSGDNISTDEQKRK
jgi:hypothetical protein